MYTRDLNDVSKLMMLLVVYVCYSLLESIMMTRVPIMTRHMAVRSYLATNFSPRYLLEMTTLMMIAKEELQAARVRSKKGNAANYPRTPMKIRKNPQSPFMVQNMFLWIVFSVEEPVYAFLSWSICADF